jgi:hypothetical protein
MCTLTFVDLSADQKITFLIQLAKLRLMERRWLAGDDQARIDALSLLDKMGSLL